MSRELFPAVGWRRNKRWGNTVHAQRMLPSTAVAAILTVPLGAFAQDPNKPAATSRFSCDEMTTVGAPQGVSGIVIRLCKPAREASWGVSWAQSYVPRPAPRQPKNR